MIACPDCGTILLSGLELKRHAVRCTKASPAERRYYKAVRRWPGKGQKLPKWALDGKPQPVGWGWRDGKDSK